MSAERHPTGLFQLDRGDLDLGLYRIVDLKAKEITDFLANDLLPQVQTALAGNATGGQAKLEKELADARAQAKELDAAAPVVFQKSLA